MIWLEASKKSRFFVQWNCRFDIQLIFLQNPETMFNYLSPVTPERYFCLAFSFLYVYFKITFFQNYMKALKAFVKCFEFLQKKDEKNC